MGYIAHHGIVVTTWKKEHAEAAHAKATEIFANQVTPMLITDVNEYYTFFIGPDGSKEGWEESHAGDNQRETFKRWASDSGLYLDVATFRYGGDEPELASIEVTK